MSAFRILLVDDEPFIHFALDAELRDVGLDATLSYAESGPETLAFLAKAAFDLLITDYSMPGMNGLELIAAVRQRYPALPIVMYSTSESVLADALRAGAQEFVRKGSSREALWPYVARMIAQRDEAT